MKGACETKIHTQITRQSNLPIVLGIWVVTKGKRYIIRFSTEHTFPQNNRMKANLKVQQREEFKLIWLIYNVSSNIYLTSFITE